MQGGNGCVAPDFRVTASRRCIDALFAALIRGIWLAKVIIMSERSAEQIRESLDSRSLWFLCRVDWRERLHAPKHAGRMHARLSFLIAAPPPSGLELVR